MNTDYENRGQRINAENRLQKEEDWPRLVVPEFTNKNHERRYAGTGTQKQHTERPKSGYTTERTVKSKSGDKAKRTVRPKSGRTTSRAVRTKRMRADSTREILTKIKEAAAKSANLKTLAGFSENQSGKSILKKTKHIFLFPLVFIYFEILLRIFGGTGVLNHFIYPVLFGIAAGLFAACITTLFRKKVNRIITAVILFATGLLFIVECLIKDSFQVYMTFKSILSGAGGVMGEFRSELINSIVFGIPVILLFFLPGILYLIFGKKKLPTRRQKRPFSAMVLAGAAVFMLIASLTASIGSSKAQYKTQYDFNTATQYFGLMTSVRLDGKYALFGNKQGDTLGFETTSADTDKKVEEDKAEEAVPEKKEYGDNVSDLDFAALSESASDETIRNMHAYVNSQTPSKQNDYTGLFEGKNLIMICAEAFSDVVINKELTPTLYRLTHNGIYFSEYYQPTWGEVRQAVNILSLQALPRLMV